MWGVLPSKQAFTVALYSLNFFSTAVRHSNYIWIEKKLQSLLFLLLMHNKLLVKICIIFTNQNKANFFDKDSHTGCTDD